VGTYQLRCSFQRRRVRRPVLAANLRSQFGAQAVLAAQAVAAAPVRRRFTTQSCGLSVRGHVDCDDGVHEQARHLESYTPTTGLIETNRPR
jgi:hypothetical protein